MRVESLLITSAQDHPGKAALIDGERTVTYAELNDLSSRWASVLRGQGVCRGDRVVVMAENSIETVVSVFGIFRAGAVFAPVNPTTKTDKLIHLVRDCDARVIITQSRLLPVVRQAMQKSPLVCACIVVDGDVPADFREGIALAPAVAEAPDTSPADAGIDMDLAMLIYTSGSTGEPKGVMLSHYNLWTAIESIVQYLELTSDDVLLNALPLTHGYGLSQVLTGLRAGATVIIEKSFAFPRAVVNQMARYKVTGFALAPTMAALLLQTSLPPEGLPHLRYITNAAAALPVPHILRLQEKFPNTRIFSMYGQTECIRGTYLDPAQLTAKPDSVGFAIPNTEAFVVDENGNPLPPGEIGQLVIRGGHVMCGYWQNPEATAKALKPGRYPWERVLYTNDLFRTDEQGYLYFVSRRDDIIKTRGEKVSPKEIENVLYSMEEVAEAAAVGVPDPFLGDAIKVVIVLAEGRQLSAQQVIRYCASRLEDFMVPKHVEFRSEMPKTASGKIRRCEVRREAAQAALAEAEVVSR